MADIPAIDAQISQSRPPQRIPKACDECRRRKIKCNGTFPCAHCTRHTLQCVYQLRRRTKKRAESATNKVEELASRLQNVESLLRTRTTDFPTELASGTTVMSLDWRKDSLQDNEIQTVSPIPESDTGESTESAEAMMAATGQLDMDRDGRWDYYGHGSGVAFFQRLEEVFGNRVSADHRRCRLTSRIPIPLLFEMRPAADVFNARMAILPSRRIVDELVSGALDDACALECFIHRPTFDRLLERVYAISPSDFGSEERNFIPLLYATLSLGCLFTPHTLERMGYECAALEGSKYFHRARQMIDIEDCRNILSLQAVVFLNMFLQCTARLSRCYSYIGVTVTLALRMGLHRSIQMGLDPHEADTRCRMFWAIRNMEARLSSLLGLPRLLPEDDIDQGMPVEIITDPCDKEKPSVTSFFYTNAYTKLTQIMAKIVKHVYPIKRKEASNVTSKYLVSYAKVRQMEDELDEWKLELPPDVTLDTAMKSAPRANYLLHMYYSHIRLMLYRPFLHYISKNLADKADRRAQKFAASCIKVSREIIRIGIEMNRQDLLVGAYWFEFYTIFSAIMALVFPILDRSHDLNVPELLKDAIAGREILMHLAPTSMAAKRCCQILGPHFECADGEDRDMSKQSPALDEDRLDIGNMPLGTNAWSQASRSQQVGHPPLVNSSDYLRGVSINANRNFDAQHMQPINIGTSNLMNSSPTNESPAYVSNPPLTTDPRTQDQGPILWPRLGEWSQDQLSLNDQLHVQQFGSLPPYMISLPQISPNILDQSSRLAELGPETRSFADWPHMGSTQDDVNVIDMLNVDDWNNAGSDVGGSLFW